MMALWASLTRGEVGVVARGVGAVVVEDVDDLLAAVGGEVDGEALGPKARGAARRASRGRPRASSILLMMIMRGMLRSGGDLS